MPRTANVPTPYDDLLTLRLRLQAAEDALNASDKDEPALAEAYHAASDRFIEAPARTPSDMLLKLERLADIASMANDPKTSTNRIVLNLIENLRSSAGHTKPKRKKVAGLVGEAA